MGNLPNSSHSPPQKVFYFDAIRACAICAVVLTHVITYIRPAIDAIPEGFWPRFLTDLCTVLALPAVPLFVMVSGALLLDPGKTESLALFFRKRVLSVFVPFASWAIFYLLLRRFVHHEEMSMLDAIKNLVAGPIYLHLWFLYMLSGLYLATPILRIVTRNAKRSDLVYLLSLWFLFESIILFFNNFFAVKIGFQFFTITSFAGYFVLGHYLSSSRRVINKGKMLLAFCALSFMLIWIDFRFPSTRDQWNSFFNPIVVIISILAFCAFRDCKYSSTFSAKISKPVIAVLNSYSFGIYFVHIAVLEALNSGQFGFVLNGLSYSPLLGITFTTVATILISVALLFLLRKIPIARFLAVARTLRFND